MIFKFLKSVAWIYIQPFFSNSICLNLCHQVLSKLYQILCTFNVWELFKNNQKLTVRGERESVNRTGLALVILSMNLAFRSRVALLGKSQKRLR